MIEALGLALDTATLVLAVSFSLSIAVHALPAIGGDVDYREEEARRRLLLPSIGAIVVVGLGFISSIWDAWTCSPDHCGETVVHPPYLCWLHPASATYHIGLPEAVAIAIVVASAALVGKELFTWGRTWTKLRELRTMADLEAGEHLRMDLARSGLAWPGEIVAIPAEQPICFVYGLSAPSLVVSTGVLDRMPFDELRHIVAHELAHVRRGDTVWKLVWQLASLTHLPGLGRRAFSAWSLAAEAVCDRDAAGTVGSRLAIAETLLHFQRLINRFGVTPSAVGVGFAQGGALELRIHQLLTPSATTRLQRVLQHWPFLILACLVCEVNLVHTSLEALLRFLHQH